MANEIVLRKPDILHGLSSRQEAEHLLQNQIKFTTAFHESRELGREMLLRFEAMDTARKELEKHGIYTLVEYEDAALKAAYHSLRRFMKTEDLEVPDFLRKD